MRAARGKRFIVRSDEILTAFAEIAREGGLLVGCLKKRMPDRPGFLAVQIPECGTPVAAACDVLNGTRHLLCSANRTSLDSLDIA